MFSSSMRPRALWTSSSSPSRPNRTCSSIPSLPAKRKSLRPLSYHLWPFRPLRPPRLMRPKQQNRPGNRLERAAKSLPLRPGRRIGPEGGRGARDRVPGLVRGIGGGPGLVIEGSETTEAVTTAIGGAGEVPSAAAAGGIDPDPDLLPEDGPEAPGIRRLRHLAGHVLLRQPRPQREPIQLPLMAIARRQRLQLPSCRASWWLRRPRPTSSAAGTTTRRATACGATCALTTMVRIPSSWRTWSSTRC